MASPSPRSRASLHLSASRPLRVALFTGAYNHIADGVSLTLNRTVAYLLQQGVDVRVFAPTTGTPALTHEGDLVPVRSLALPGRPEYRVSVGLTPAIRRELDAFRPTLVHIATPDFLGIGALRYARRRRIPVVASYHTHFASYLDYYGLNRIAGGLWRYLRWFYGQCEHVYVPSPSMMRVLEEQDIDAHLRLWSRGVDTSLFSPAKRSATWRASLGFREDDVVVSFVGRLVWEKGLRVYADVIERLESRGIPHRSLIVGDGPARAELVAALPRTVFAGHLAGDVLARSYASSDVFLFPSETETFGNVTLEAMACGVPAVCADATGSASLVVPGETGFLAPPRDVEAFADAVGLLATDHALRRRMSAAGAAQAQAYAWPAVLGQLLSYYRTLIPALPGGDGCSTGLLPTLAPAGARS